ncbi:hypothetical protein ACIGXF_38345 [Streptomyces sp. NPDC053086]|uniref:hypothetical protein n=1 Tax=unclassified Streptomyces TaxID=2593676 RepID=UPI0037CCF705
MEIAVGYVFAWLVRKARRVTAPADAEVDRVLDAGIERLHTVVGVKLGADPALEQAREEARAGDGELSESTRRQLVDALDEATVNDTDFAQALAQALAAVQAVGPVDIARYTGVANASGGGSATTGVVRPGGTGGGSATAEHTGDATAQGTGSRASTGVDYT